MSTDERIQQIIDILNPLLAEDALAEQAEHDLNKVSMTSRQRQVFLDHASPTLQQYFSMAAKYAVNADSPWRDVMVSNLLDGLRKQMTVLAAVENPSELKYQAAIRILIFANWHIKNYSLFLDIEKLPGIDDVPQKPEWQDIGTVERFLAFMKERIIPGLKEYARELSGLDADALEQDIQRTEQEIINKNMAGIDIVRPISRDAWQPS